MPKITFLPDNKTIEVPAGTELLDAARGVDVSIDSPCGGKGTCGKCVVRIESGSVKSDNLGILSLSAVNRGYRLACRTTILDEELRVEIPEQSIKEGGQFMDETADTCMLREELFPADYKYTPIVRGVVLDIPPPQLEDGVSDVERLTRSLRLRIGSIGGPMETPVDVSLAVMRELAETLRRGEWTVTVAFVEDVERIQVVRVEAGDISATPYYGIGVDIGTTTVAVQLIELKTAAVLATRTDYNHQIDCGLDVISRINYARRADRLVELRTRILKTINRLIRQLCKGNDVVSKNILSAVVAGNTTMIHLLLALPPEHIRLAPYTPTLLDAPFFNAGEIGMEIFPGAAVYISPSVGSYVGGDITSGLLCSRIAGGVEEVELFIDIGTNGELVLGNNDFLMTCACSAGPAFEGGGIEKGMHAAMGAIDSVSVDVESGTATYSTIGNVAAKGICGTGMIALLAELFQSRWLDASGKLKRDTPCAAIEVTGRQARYVIVSAPQSGNGEPIYITEIDIDNIIRAKAAIYAACGFMLAQVGLGFGDLHKIYIAGGFGRYLDIERAVVIGLLPDIERGKFQYIGNSSLMGAYMMSVSAEHRKRNRDLFKRMTYLELSTDPAYMDQFTGACFLPHTDAKQFPSIKPK